MKQTKKAISPVVATALLLVVAVVAVVSFQTWFNTYQSGLTVQVESQSDASSALTIERLEGTTNAVVYIRNSASAAVQIDQVRILQDGTSVCSNGAAINATAETVSNQTVSSCSLTSGQTYNVVLVTEDGVFSETEIAR